MANKTYRYIRQSYILENNHLDGLLHLKYMYHSLAKERPWAEYLTRWWALF